MLTNVLEELLKNEERHLTYEDGFPVIWDSTPSREKVLEVLNTINVLKAPEVIQALKEGLKLPEAEVFFWISPSGEIDYGVVQGDYFITLWVPGAQKLKTVDEAREKVLSLAREKLERERRNKEEALQDAVNPWLFKERKERIQNLKFLKKNLHPLWTDLHEEVQKLLEREYPKCPWCGKRHPDKEHYQCAPDAHLESDYEERFEME